MEFTQIDEEIEAVQAELRLKLAAKAAAQAAYDRSEYAKLKKKEQDEAEARRKKLLADLVSTVVAPAKKEVADLVKNWAALEQQIRDWNEAGLVLAAHHLALCNSVIHIQRQLKASILSTDWRGSFKTDAELVAWLNSQVAEIVAGNESVSFAVPVTVRFNQPVTLAMINSLTKEDLAQAIRGRGLVGEKK